MCEIVVVNKPAKGSNGAVYIGRGGRGLTGSPLANPRRLGDPKPGGGVWERGETVDLFAADLAAVLDATRPVAQWWNGRLGRYLPLSSAARAAIVQEIDRLAELARRGRLELDCFCKRPDRPVRCHGDAIRTLLLARLRPGGGAAAAPHACDDCGPLDPWEHVGRCALCKRTLCGACAICHIKVDCPAMEADLAGCACGADDCVTCGLPF